MTRPSNISRRFLLSSAASYAPALILSRSAIAQVINDDEMSTDPAVLDAIDDFSGRASYLVGPGGKIYGRNGIDLKGGGPELLTQFKVIEPFTWAWVGAQLAGGVIAYIGGMAFARVIGEPSMGELAQIIRNAVQEIKEFIREELRRALAEEVLLALEASTEATYRNLKRYAAASASDRRNYRYLIEAADLDTNRGIALAQKYELNALPVYANFVSLRALAIRAFYEVDRNKPAMRAFADELIEYRKYVTTTLGNYGLSLDPERRLGQPVCEWNRQGGQFPISYYGCCYKEDGKDNPANCVGSTQGDSTASSIESRVNSRIASLRKAKADQFSVFQQRTGENFISPLNAIIGKWDVAVAEIRRRYS